MPLPFNFDFKNPDYRMVFEWRAENLRKIRKNPEVVPLLKKHYCDNPAQFLTDWACILEPRNIERNLPAAIPFLLFPRQEEFVLWALDNWRNRRHMLVDKSRDSGMSWLTLALCTTLCLFHRDMVIGVGSRKEIYVDSMDDPKALFPKVRYLLSMLPEEFRGGWDQKKHAPYMRVIIPGTNSILAGEAGDNLGRGARTSLYMLDEAAFFSNPQKIDAALSNTSNCLIYISTPNGRNNPFAKKRFSGLMPVFSYHWRDDPRKDEEWYEEQKKKLLYDSVIIAQELDIDYNASVEGVLIPAAWVQAAIGAFEILGVENTGQTVVAYDPADEGKDLNCVTVRKGNEIIYTRTWSGRGSDVYTSVLKVIDVCDQYGCAQFLYDADGLGSPIRGDVNAINAERIKSRKNPILPVAFRGSAAVKMPEAQGNSGVKNKDRYYNYKAQCWQHLRDRFLATYRAVVEKSPYEAEALISLDKSNPELHELTAELSQPLKILSPSGKMMIDKTPPGAQSPNRADTVMMAFSKNFRGLYDF